MPPLHSAGSGDYERRETIFTFSSGGQLSFTETVLVLDDDVVENTERFSVGLSAPPGETGLTLPDDPAVVYIVDDDGKLQWNLVNINSRGLSGIIRNFTS